MQASRIGAVIVLAMVVVYLICRLIGERGRLVSRSYHREKDRTLRRQIARSLEESAPIHLDIGSTSEGNLSGGAVLKAAEATEMVSAQMAFADEPWLITAPGGMSVQLEKDAVQVGMEAADYGSFFDADCAVFSGASPIEHMTGNNTAQGMAPSALHLSVGSFGPSPALSDTLCSRGETLCVGGDDLVSQSVAAVTADAVFIGEQFAEIPDSLSRNEKRDPSLLTMDIMRWVLIAAIAAFAAVGLSGL